jgi:uncharacterized membrane protein required for colicin V production
VRAPSVNWIRWSLAIASLLTSAFLGLRYYNYASVGLQLRQPHDKICAGNVSCIAEIKGEAYSDLLIGLVFSPVVFVFVLAALALIFVMFTFLSETKPWRKSA